MEIKKLHEKFRSGELTVTSYITEIVEKAKLNKFNSFITVNEEKAIEKAKKLDEKLSSGEEISGLFGVPVALKDNILTKGLRTTAASKSLKDFVPIYDAKIVERLNETDAVIIGKTNMDEFAMGSSSETSYFGASINPFNESLTPGGSSSGSATAVAGEEVILAIGTDTGGSVRNPADFCHVIGFTPTYGAIPREGVISMSNSFDRVGVLGNKVSEIREIFSAIKGKCDSDFTSLDIEDFNEEIDFSNLKVATLKLKEEYGVDQEIKASFDLVLAKFQKLGAKVDTLNIDYLEYINQVYTVIMAIEAESNIAKIDGLRYGQSSESYTSTEDFYIRNRSENFGEEVKRRLVLGNYFSSKENNQKYYKQAMKIRGAIREQIDEIFSNYDVIITPTTTLKPKKVGESMEDSYASFDSGMFNLITNICDIPSISIPMEKDKTGSIQIAAKRYEDMKLLTIAEKIEGSI